MKRSSAFRSPPARRFPAVLVLGLPLAIGAVWLSPFALRWMQGGDAGPLIRTTSATVAGARSGGSSAVAAPQAVPAPTAKPVPLQASLPRLELEVHSRDPAARADALAGLATAPREQALPILQNLLKDGAYPDRQLVIESLAIMARLQGDADERIRTAFRVEIYDGSDEATSASAQRALADLEEDLR